MDFFNVFVFSEPFINYADLSQSLATIVIFVVENYDMFKDLSPDNVNIKKGFLGFGLGGKLILFFLKRLRKRKKRIIFSYMNFWAKRKKTYDFFYGWKGIFNKQKKPIYCESSLRDFLNKKKDLEDQRKLYTQEIFQTLRCQREDGFYHSSIFNSFESDSKFNINFENYFYSRNFNRTLPSSYSAQIKGMPSVKLAQSAIQQVLRKSFKIDKEKFENSTTTWNELRNRPMYSEAHMKALAAYQNLRKESLKGSLEYAAKNRKRFKSWNQPESLKKAYFDFADKVEKLNTISSPEQTKTRFECFDSFGKKK